MKYRRIAAFILCLVMLTSTGCSVGKKGSSSGGGTSYSSSTKKYDIESFSFEVSEDLEVAETNVTKDHTMGDVYRIFISNALKMLAILAGFPYNSK